MAQYVYLLPSGRGTLFGALECLGIMAIVGFRTWAFGFHPVFVILAALAGYGFYYVLNTKFYILGSILSVLLWGYIGFLLGNYFGHDLLWASFGALCGGGLTAFERYQLRGGAFSEV